MSELNNPLDIIKRLDVKQNVTIRVIDEPTGKVVQEHIGHNAATNSLLTGIAHYLMGDGVLNQAQDTLSMWVPQYMSVGTMGLTSQDMEYDENNEPTYLPAGIGYTPVAPSNATPTEKDLNEILRFEEYINQTPGFGADGYDAYTNNNREWFGLGRTYSQKPAKIVSDYFTEGDSYILTQVPITGDKDSIISVTIYPDGVVNESSSTKSVLSITEYSLSEQAPYELTITASVPSGSRISVIYSVESADAANCELIKSNELRSKITYRNLIPEVQSEIPNTLDVVYSTFISTGALKEFRGNRDYIYITEAGLWSKPYYNNSGDNGLLAGYRIMPTDDEVLELALQENFTGDGTTVRFTLQQTAIEISSVSVNGEFVSDYDLDTINNQVVFTEAPANSSSIEIIYTYKPTDSWKDMSKSENREAVKKSIIRVGTNQVAQIIWKLQLGGLEQLNGLRYIYPSQYPEEVWNVWSST